MQCRIFVLMQLCQAFVVGYVFGNAAQNNGIHFKENVLKKLEKLVREKSKLAQFSLAHI